MKQVNLQDGSSADLLQENMQHLRELFPDAFTEKGVNFTILRQLLGDMKVLDEGEEKYGLNWHGKKQARQIALTPSFGTLLPCPEESLDWDATQNLFIEGDNLEVLKLLKKSYSNSIKMIYIDPPYNTGREFVYSDKFQDNLQTYLKYTGQKNGEGMKFTSNTETSGRMHTNWLNMMYPRLMLAKDLLSSDGVLFISINDKEASNLKALLNDLFGEENFLSTLVWDKNHSAQAGIFKAYHEYVFVYSKNSENISTPKNNSGDLFEAGAIKRESIRHPSTEFTFPVGTHFDAPDGTELTGVWGNVEKVELISGRMICKNRKLKEEVTLKAAYTQKDQMKHFFYGNRDSLLDSRGQKIVDFYFTASGKVKIVKKRSVETPQTTLKNYGNQGSISTDLADLFELDETPLDNPKPWKMIYDFISWFTDKDDIILDFFAGSATTAQAVMKKNLDDESSRKFIMVQLPEKTEEQTTAYKAGFKTISELAKRRICLFAEKTKKEISKLDVDFGFKVFKLASSNIKVWNPDRSDLEGSLLDHKNHLIEGRTEQDVLYELLLKRGVSLTSSIKTRKIGNKNVYSIGFGKIIVCLDDLIVESDIEFLAAGIISWQKELKAKLNTEVLKTHVFFKDSAFHDDIVKTNMVAILSQNGIYNVRSL